MRNAIVALVILAAVGCGGPCADSDADVDAGLVEVDAGLVEVDAGQVFDAGQADAEVDAGQADADAGMVEVDAGQPDAGGLCNAEALSACAAALDLITTCCAGFQPYEAPPVSEFCANVWEGTSGAAGPVCKHIHAMTCAQIGTAGMCFWR